MATFFVGDIHGNATALGALLASIEKELKGEDTIAFLGDYIDRGPNSRGCVEQILRLRNRTPAKVVTSLGADGRPRPRVCHNTIDLDTSEYGVLTANRLPDRRVFQAEE